MVGRAHALHPCGTVTLLAPATVSKGRSYGPPIATTSLTMKC
jgi:hypothetical protein